MLVIYLGNLVVCRVNSAKELETLKIGSSV